MISRLKVTTLCLLIACLSAFTVTAQKDETANNGTDIDCGDSISNETDGNTVSYGLELEEGQVIVVLLESDDFDTKIELYQDGDLVAEDDDGAGNLNSLLTYYAQDNGDYELVVTSYNGEPEGAYDLEYNCSGACDVVSDELDEGDTFDHEFEVEEDSMYLLLATSEDFDTFLLVNDQDGDFFNSDDDSGAEYNSLLVIEAATDGDYTAEVSAVFNNAGDFDLVICEDVEGLDASVQSDIEETPEFVIDTIECDSIVDGEITSGAYFSLYTFEAGEGDELTITMEATDGDLDTYLALFAQESFNGGGGPLAENDDADGSNSEIVYEVEADGSYVIYATRFSFDAGSSTGEFELELQCD